MTPIPVYIVIRDWLEGLRPSIDFFATLPDCDPIIFDSASTFPPLLEWYETECPFPVIRHRANAGPRGVWQYVEPSEDGYYCVTDGDLSYDGVPDDLMRVCVNALERYPDVCKVGVGLRIDDIPNDYPFRLDAIERERKFWRTARDDLWYEAEIDTTFAVYKADRTPCTYGPALRSGAPYVARHLPWYVTPENASEDWDYFCRHSSGHTGAYYSTLSKQFLSKPPRVLCICAAGNSRSAALAYLLKGMGVEAIAVGADVHSSETLLTLSRWATHVVVMRDTILDRIPIELRDRAYLCDVGADRYFRGHSEELLDQCRAFIEDKPQLQPGGA